MHKPLTRQLRRQSPAGGSFTIAWFCYAARFGRWPRKLGRRFILRGVLLKLGELQFKLVDEFAAAF